MNARLGKDSFWLLAARLGSQALMALFTILLARRLGSAGFGEYALLVTLIFSGNMLTTFGTDMLLMREIAARGDLSRLPAVLLLQLGLSALFVMLVVFGAPFFPNQSAPAVLALRIYSLALFPLAFYTVFSSALRGGQHMTSYALLGLVSILLQVALVLFAPFQDIAALALWLLLIQTLLALLAGLVCSLQIQGFWRGWRFSARALPALVRAAAQLAMLALLGALYQKLSIYMLSALAGAALTGWYAAALRVLEASKGLHIPVFTALFPAMARAGPARGFRRLGVLLLAGAVLIALLLSWLAAPLVTLLFGPGFAASIPALRILAWMLVPYTLNTFLTLAFVAAGQERKVAAALGFSLALLALLNLWWVPRFGLAGAAWAALVAEGSQALALLAQRGQPVELIKRRERHELSEPS